MPAFLHRLLRCQRSQRSGWSRVVGADAARVASSVGPTRRQQRREKDGRAPNPADKPSQANHDARAGSCSRSGHPTRLSRVAAALKRKGRRSAQLVNSSFHVYVPSQTENKLTRADELNQQTSAKGPTKYKYLIEK